MSQSEAQRQKTEITRLMEQRTRAIANELDERLIDAAAKGLLASVRAALAAGANPLAASATPRLRGMDALMAAVWRGHKECAVALLPVSNPLAANHEGNTALALAVFCRDKADRPFFVELLAPVSDAKAGSAGNQPPLLVEAAWKRCLRSVKALLPLSDVNATDKNGRSAAHYAAMWGHARMLKLLLAAGATPDQADSEGCALLSLAAGSASFACAQALLPLVDANGTKEDGALTPLHYAAAQGRARTIKALLAAGADANAPQHFGETPLSYAANYGCPATVRALLPFSDLSMKNKLGQNALMIAAKSGNANTLRILAKRIDPAEKDNEGRTALILAADSWPSPSACIRFLARFGGLEERGDDGETALARATRTGLAEAVETLIGLGASLSARTRAGDSLLEAARSRIDEDRDRVAAMIEQATLMREIEQPGTRDPAGSASGPSRRRARAL